MKIEVTKCDNCIFKEYERGQGSSFYICSHRERDSYEYIIKVLKAIPEWCPLRDELVEIQLKD